MKVSLIVPVYNAEHVLFETLGNLVHQTFFDQYPGEGEIVFVNDCSNDRSGTILEMLHRQFPDRTRIIHLSENLGPGGARNVGVIICSWIAMTLWKSPSWKNCMRQ